MASGARIAGIVWMLPAPLCVIIAVQWKHGRFFELGVGDMPWKLFALEASLIIICAIVGFVIASISWSPFQESKGRRRKRRRVRDEDSVPHRPVRSAAAREDSDDEIPIRGRSESGINPWLIVGIGAGVLGVLMLVIVLVVVLTRQTSTPAPVEVAQGDAPARPVAPPVVAQDPPVIQKKLRPYSPPDRSFTVLLPGIPQHSVKQVNGTVAHFFLLLQPQVGYTITFFDSTIQGDLPADKLELVLDKTRDEFLRGAGFQLTRETRSLVAGRYPARDLEGTSLKGPGRVFRCRLALVGRRNFSMGVVGNPAEVNSANATEFLQSLVPNPVPAVAVTPAPLPGNPPVLAPAGSWQPPPPELAADPLSPAKLPGLLAYWPFEDFTGTQAADASGNGLTARAHGTQRIKGVVGMAAAPGREKRLPRSGDRTPPQLRCGNPLHDRGVGGHFQRRRFLFLAPCAARCPDHRPRGESGASAGRTPRRRRARRRPPHVGGKGPGRTLAPCRACSPGQRDHDPVPGRGLAGARARSDRVAGPITTNLRALGAERYQALHPAPGQQAYFQGAIDEILGIFGRDLSLAEVAALAGKKK